MSVEHAQAYVEYAERWAGGQEAAFARHYLEHVTAVRSNPFHAPGYPQLAPRTRHEIANRIDMELRR